VPQQLRSVAMESLAAGDTIETASGVRWGDIVVVVERASGHFLLTAVTVEEAAKYEGPKYRAVRGAGPGDIQWAPIELGPSGRSEGQVQEDQGQQPCVTRLPQPDSPRKPWWKFW
jgi:hypothetical protein